MSNLFNTFLVQPLFNALMALYATIAFDDIGLAIIFLTIAIRVIFYPLFYKSYKNQTLLQKIQPEIKKIQKKFKGNKEHQAQELLRLYKENNVNPFSGFFLILIQLPILIALYRVFLGGFAVDKLNNLYSFVIVEAPINVSFLSLIDLSKTNIIIVGLAAIAQFFHGKISLPKKAENSEVSAAERIGKQMMFIGPILTLVILYSLPSAIGLYWLTSSGFSVIQQFFINKSLNKENTKNGELSNTSEENI